MKEGRCGPRHFFRLRAIEKLLLARKKSGVILDVGSGDGALALRLAGKGFLVYAMEPDESWCSILRSRLEGSLLKDKVRVMCRPLEEGFGENILFDAVICSEVLEHVKDDSLALKSINRIIKDDGVLIVSVPLINKGWDLWDEYTGHLRLYEPQELLKKLGSGGFQADRIVSWGVPFGKLYHKHIFLGWAKRVSGEEEIIRPNSILTRIGRCRALSAALSALFFADVLFTPLSKGIGVIIRADKVKPASA